MNSFNFFVVMVANYCLGVVSWNEPNSTLQHKYVVGEIGKSDNTYALVFSSTGKWLFSGGNHVNQSGRLVTKWDVEKRTPLAKYSNGDRWRISHLALSPSGKYLAVGNIDDRISVYDAKGKLIRSFKHFENQATATQVLAFVDDENLFFSNFHGTGRRCHVVNGEGGNYYLGASDFGVRMAITRDASVIAYFSNYSLRFQLTNGSANDGPKFLLGVVEKEDRVDSLAISDDAAHVVMSTDTGKLYLIDVENNKLKKTWQAFKEGLVCSMIYLPKKQIFVAANFEGFIKFWDGNGKELASVRKYRSCVCALAVSPDGKILVTAGEAQPIVFWDLEEILKRKE